MHTNTKETNCITEPAHRHGDCTIIIEADLVVGIGNTSILPEKILHCIFIDSR